MRAFLAAAGVLAATLASAAPNSVSRYPDPLQLNGRWNGVDLEQRSNCRTPENNGSRGTYAQFDVVIDAQGNLAITQTGITGLNCTYVGRHGSEHGRLAWQGSYSCTDGKRGDFTSTASAQSATAFTIRLAIQLTSSEACRIDGMLSMARLGTE
jgi:hypothetical protein